jgi:hypothetical protein
MSDTETKEHPAARSKRRANGFPRVVSEWQRNDRELLRVSLDQFNDHFTIGVRTWQRDPQGTFRPHKNGLTVGVKHLPALAEAIAKALHQAHDLGLIASGTYARKYKRR